MQCQCWWSDSRIYLEFDKNEDEGVEHSNREVCSFGLTLEKATKLIRLLEMATEEYRKLDKYLEKDLNEC